MNSLVSIIIPIYNVGNYLELCIESVLAQTYQNLEIILVNDGSKDDCLKICEKYAAMDQRIIVVNKENGGISSARNAGLEVATGRYCYFLDGDDSIKSNAMEECVAAIEENRADLVVFNVDHVDENGNLIKRRNFMDKEYNIRNEEERFELYKEFFLWGFGYEVWNKLYDLEIIQKNNLRFVNNYEVFAEDTCFNAFYLIYVKKMICMDKILYNYLIRADSTMRQQNKEYKFVNFISLLQHIERQFAEKNCTYMKDNLYRLFPSVMHNRYEKFRLNDLADHIGETRDEEQKAFLDTMVNQVIANKKQIKKEYNNMEYWNSRYGSDLVLETYLTKYADNIWGKRLVVLGMHLNSLIKLCKKMVRKIKGFSITMALFQI